MWRRGRRVATLALVLAGMGLLGSCGDDGPTGPQFGNLVFTPSFVTLPGDVRNTVLVLRNSGPRDLGPINVGSDVFIRSPNTLPDSFCTGARLDFVPSAISSLAEGAEETVSVFLDLTAATPELCPPARYDAILLAAVNGQGLAGATIRFDWDGTPP